MMLTLMLALTLHDIAWLAGDWQSTDGKQCVEEHWTTPSSNLMVGMSRTTEDGRTVSFEFLRIEARADGVYYMAQPGGRPPVDFKLSSAPGPELVFVNPGHGDHLKRIVYRRESADRISARVEGEDGGRAFTADFAYRRGALNNAASRCGAVK
jgi:hypothetical protein